MSDARSKPGCLLAAGLLLTIGALVFAALRWVMGFGSAFVARTEAEAESVFHDVLIGTACSALALVIGLALAVWGAVGLWRGRRREPG